MADIKSLIIASVRTMTTEEQANARALLAKLGVEVSDKDLSPYRAEKTTPKRQVIEVEEYNLELFYHCTTCGSVREQFFHMRRLPDNSGVFSVPLISRSRDGIWKTEMRSIAACGQCYQVLVARYTIEDMAKILVKLGTRGVPIAEFLHGRNSA